MHMGSIDSIYTTSHIFSSLIGYIILLPAGVVLRLASKILLQAVVQGMTVNLRTTQRGK